MKSKLILLISILIQILFSILFFFFKEMDVIRLLILVLSPMLLSAGLVLLIKPNKQQFYLKLLIFSLPNLVFNIVMTFFVHSRLDEILRASLKYETTNLQISQSNSPIASLMLILAVSVGMHYLAGQVKLSLSRS